MRTIFKITATALVVLGISGTSFAGTINGFFVGAEALDFQPRNGDLDYVYVFPVAFLSAVDSISGRNVNTTYKWDWRAYAGVKFCGSEDITVSWLRFHTNDSNSTLTPTNESLPRYLELDFWNGTTANVSFNLDDAYGVYGHTANLGAWSVRVGGGVEWARVRSNMQINSSFGTVAPILNFGYDAKSNTSGVGPRLEMDMAYHFPFGFSVFGNINGALLIATRDISLNTLNDDFGDFPSMNYTDRSVVVPKLGTRLGIAYSYTFGQLGGEGAGCTTTTVTLAAGWQAESYIHAIERPDPTQTTIITDLNAPSPSRDITSTTKVSNYGDQGLFLGVKVGTDWV